MFQVGQGVSSPKDWQNQSGKGIVVNIDTSHCGFTETPHYITSLEGESKMWATSGSNCIYHASPTGFSVYLRWASKNGVDKNGDNLRADLARHLKWVIRWTAIQV